MGIHRRRFLASAAGIAAGTWGFARARGAADATPAIRQITRGPKCHWFGYYDKLQFDPSGRYALGMEVDFEHRSPRPDDVIKIGMVDLRGGDQWIELGESRAWCWQQGCMLQWLPGSAREVIWNDRDGDHYVCHILDVTTRRRRTLPHPIYAVSPDGQWAISTSFSRLADRRPGYGYAGVPDPHREERAPKQTGIFRLDLATGRQDLLCSVADIAAIPFAGPDNSEGFHWFNHLLVNPDGSRFVFLHRWTFGKGRLSRMVSVRADGSDVRVLIGSGWVSHFNWRDPANTLAYSKTSYDAQDWGFYLWEDKERGAVELVGNGVMTGDGHCSYLPGNRWIINDTYPDRERKQHLYLFDTQTRRRVELGAFFQSSEYWDTSPLHEWRVDLHPRLGCGGRCVTIDSPYTGQGRQLHLLDLASLLATG